MIFFCLLVTLAVGSANSVLQLGQIPGLNNLPISDLSQDGVENAFKEKCANQTNDEKYFDKIVEAKDKLENCTTGFVNVTVLQNEIEAAKPTGDLDVVFGKYCRKMPPMFECIKTFYQTLKPCLTDSEKDNAKLTANITKSMYDFLCYKDGDRIALFIAEGGIECIESKQTELQNCGKTKLGENPQIPDTKDKQCNVLSDLQGCVVNELEKCKEPTPANIIEALFKYVKKLAKCPK